MRQKKPYRLLFINHTNLRNFLSNCPFCCIGITTNLYCTEIYRGIFNYRQTFSHFSIIIFQRQMSTHFLQNIDQINRILQLNSSLIQTHLNSVNSKQNNITEKRFSDQIVLQKQLESFKINLENLGKHCHSLENENKVLKRIVSKPYQQFSAYSNRFPKSHHQISESQMQSTKYRSSMENSNYSTQFLKQSQNLNKIQIIRQQLTGLSEKLNTMTKVYEKHELDQIHANQKEEMFLSESSLQNLESQFQRQNSNKNNGIELEYLLCREELSFQDLPSKDRNQQQNFSNNLMFGSLIAKGIELRESRTLRSKEFKDLSKIIQKYRSQFNNNPLASNIKQKSTFKYR